MRLINAGMFMNKLAQRHFVSNKFSCKEGSYRCVWDERWAALLKTSFAMNFKAIAIDLLCIFGHGNEMVSQITLDVRQQRQYHCKVR